MRIVRGTKCVEMPIVGGAAMPHSQKLPAPPLH
jgi:hypothetical protein